VLDEHDVSIVDGLPVTTVARTLVDLAEVVHPDRLQRALAEAERLPLDVTGLDRYAARHGAARVRTAIAALRPEHAWTRSGLEVALLRMCDEHDLPRPATNAWVEGMEVDFLWREPARGRRRPTATSTTTRAARSRTTIGGTLELRLAGYEVLRFTDRQVEREPELVVRALAIALGA
jgi:hypothetical protein